MFVLRDYQEEAIKALFHYFETDKGKAPIVVAPTGSGKSLIIAEFCKRVCTETPKVRIMIVTDVKELIAQNEKELKSLWPQADTGAYSAGLGRRDMRAQILFAGIQSVYDKVFDFGRVDIVIVDECHMIGRSSDSRYQTFFSNLHMANPDTCIWGCSATPYRLDSGMLHEGEDALFDGIAYNVEMKRLIQNKYLVPVISKGGVKKIDLRGVHLQAGEYKANELARAADDPELVKSAVAEIISFGSDRKAWLIFAAGIDHAKNVAKAIQEFGIDCAVVTGKTPRIERDKILDSFKNGKLRCVVNIGVLTKGFNNPRCDLIALLTSTKSTCKFVQMVGRGMRPYTEKENCLLLDFGGNVTEHGVIDEIDPIHRKTVFGDPKKGDPVKECPNCRTIVNIRVLQCPACGYVFPVIAPHGDTAYGGAVMSGQVSLIDIVDFYVGRHKKPGKPDSLKLSFYDAMDREYCMWLALDHGGYATEKSISVVQRFGGKATNVDNALKEWSYWKKPIGISVKPRGKFHEIVGVKFARTEAKQNTID
jgi:DNA repair protein RadD